MEENKPTEISCRPGTKIHCFGMRFLFVCFTVFLFIHVVHPLSNCTFTDPDTGVIYDLSALTYDPTLPSPAGYDGQDMNGQTYYINFCEQVSMVNLSACSTTSPTSSCQTGSGNIHPAGATRTQRFSSSWNGYNASPNYNFTSGISLSYTEGDYCAQKGTYRSTDIMIACNPTTEIGGIDSVYDDGSCHYTVYFSSSAACGEFSGEPTLLYHQTNITMNAGDRVLVMSDTAMGWANTISLLRVSGGRAALGRVTGRSITHPHPTDWFCATTYQATTMPSFNNEYVVVGCMSGSCTVELLIGTKNVGPCFHYTETDLQSASLHYYRGDYNECKYDSMCAYPNPE